LLFFGYSFSLFYTSYQGLSLDYIRDLTRPASAQHLPQSAEQALAQRGQEIKMDIVARFNAAHQAPGTETR
jgi:hypothetical protein